MANDVSSIGGGLFRTLSEAASLNSDAVQRRLDELQAEKQRELAARLDTRPSAGALRARERLGNISGGLSVLRAGNARDRLVSSLTGEEIEFPGFDFDFADKLFAPLFGAQSDLLAEDQIAAQRNAEALRQARETRRRYFSPENIRLRLNDTPFEPPDLLGRARKFIERLRSRGSPDKTVLSPFGSVFNRASERNIFGDNYIELSQQGALYSSYRRSVALNRESASIVQIQDELRINAPVIDADFYIVYLSGAPSGDYIPASNLLTPQAEPSGSLVIQQAGTEQTIDFARSAERRRAEPVIITRDQFENLAYRAGETNNANTLDVLSFIAVSDTDGSGTVSAGDTRTPVQSIAFTRNPPPVSEIRDSLSTRSYRFDIERNVEFRTLSLVAPSGYDGQSLQEAVNSGRLSLRVAETGAENRVLELIASGDPDYTPVPDTHLRFRFADGRTGADGVRVSVSVARNAQAPLPDFHALFSR